MSVQIVVQDGMVVWHQYLPVYYVVISEESCRGVYTFSMFSDVINIQQEEHIQQEEDRAQNCILRDTRHNHC